MAPGGLEHVDGRGRLHLGEPVVGGRQERRVLQLLARQVGDVVQAAQVERAGQPEHLLVGDAELGDQQLEHLRRDGLLDLEAHRRAEAAAQQLLLEGGEEVLGVVLLDLEVLVAGDPEGVHLEHVHAGEEPLEVLADDVLQRHEPLVADGDEALEDRRHLDAGEVVLAGARVAQQHREVEREPGDVGERVRGVDGERGEDGEDPVLEQPLARLLLVAVQLGPADQLDAGVGERGHDVVAEDPRLPLGQLAGGGEDLVEHLGRHQPGRGGHGDAGGDPALEAGDADHEELVEVAGEDGQEPGPLQQRQAGVLGELEYPLVEPQPGHLAVQEPVLELLDRRDRLVVGLVRRLDVERLLGHALAVTGDVRGGRGLEGHGCQCGTTA